ncbi:MAG TPA: heavy metal-associated domain-containing protein [Saprospiraceae bacterium]|nr:heavy metal-associated domain-containing protein [Saprospiraceae bacterium]
MEHTYQLTGMTCSSCESKVKKAIESVSGVVSAEVSKDKQSATIQMQKHIPVTIFQNVLEAKYQISNDTMVSEEKPRTWLEIYTPILLIFFFITLVTILVQLKNDSFDAMIWMRHFMAGFFLVFSFFKFLNLKGFTESYVMYDVLAKKIPAWAYLYAFVEFGLGIAFLVDFNPILTNAVTLVVMTISITGVLQSVLNKQKIQCACLGAVFNLPMSTVTIIEDGIMILMSAAMLFTLMG